MPDVPISILPHDPAWRARFAEEGARLLRAFAGEALGVHHVGSTAVPDLAAKPILDVLLEVRDVGALDGRRTAAEEAGYQWLGEHGIAGRRFLRGSRLDAGSGAAYTVHVHAFGAGTEDTWRHLDFRDYLLRHPRRAADYEALKYRLMERLGHDRAAYTDAKTPFIRETERLARRWRAGE